MKTRVPIYVVMIGNRSTNMLLSKTFTGVNILCILLTLNLLSGHFGFITASLAHLISIYLILGILLLNLPLRQTLHTLTQRTPRRVHLMISLTVCLVGFLLLIISNTQLIWMSSISVFLSGLFLCVKTLDRTRTELGLLAVASFGYAIVFLLLQTLPLSWYIYQQSSLLVTTSIGSMTGTPQTLGPTTSSLGILLVSLVFLLTVFFFTSKKTKRDIVWFSLCSVGLFLLWSLYLTFLSLTTYPAIESLNYHVYFFLFSLLPPFLSLYSYHSTEPDSFVVPQKRRVIHLLKNGTVWAAVFLFVSSMIFTIVITPEDSRDDSKKVLFYGSNMVGTWDVPEYGKYGKDAVGMFGLWPVYLTTLGYQTALIVQNTTEFLTFLQPPDQNITISLNLTEYTTVIESETITKNLLDGTTIFVVSNLNTSFTDEEQTRIWEYVKDGGSLLVIGDHTNVGGIQDPLNELLAPVGISYRFDAALPLDDQAKWLTCTRLLYHPITIPMTSIDEIQYGVGASLDITSSAFPLIIGTSALSDAGNTSNQDIAYLGDYEYNKGEHLGDVILVAGAYYGKGKVLVFGDTSSFQNPALPFSYFFVQSTFAWLSRTQNSITIPYQIISSLLFLLGVVIVYYVLKNKTIPFALFPLLLCISLFISTSINPLLVSENVNNLSGHVVCIDASHGERFSIESFTDASVNGLIVNLQRNNFLPLILREFSRDTVKQSTLILFNAPTKAFTEDEVSFLHSYMQNGGVILLATGYDDKDASLPLLKEYNIDIQPTPLGPVPYVEGNLSLYQNEPRFVDSWPLSFQEEHIRSYYNFTWQNLTFHLVIFIKQGKGGLLVVSDSQYLLDKNIESIYDYWPGNILFLKYLLDELAQVEEQ
ncbi:MAG: hypothetical protein JW840_09305 [Candidatus Thermoplasmatota archaeon]|nr:hypothetical protein [Candidatus Thermoplasmatota archaeon]